ncbi:DUF4376 domain-containing protein [Methylobacterium sp. WL19]|nr:DUF4376 domain-containing protein [Methylobacterium sp. WL19]
MRTLRAYSRNARTHDEAQIGQIQALIERFGFLVPLIVDEHDTIIAGHGRLEAARRLGMEQVPVIRRPGLTDAERAALVLADNHVEPADPVTLVAYAANARWEREVAGTMWNGWPIYTDDRAQIKYLAELAAIEAGVRVDGEPWKFADGLPRPLTNIQMRNLAIAARSYVTSTFKLEFMALAQIAAGTATTTADVDAILGGAL